MFLPGNDYDGRFHHNVGSLGLLLICDVLLAAILWVSESMSLVDALARQRETSLIYERRE